MYFLEIERFYAAIVQKAKGCMILKSIGGIVSYSAPPQFHFAVRNDKFSNEKVSFVSDAYAINFDGFILNNQFLFKKFHCYDNTNLIINLFKQYGPAMVMHAKGSYALSIWDKKQNKVFVTNDLLSKRSIYYHINEGGAYFAGSYYDLLDFLSQTKYTPKINISAVKEMSSLGYLKGSSTYLEDVFYLNAFESIVIDMNTSTAEVIHHEAKDMCVPINEAAIIDAFDVLFTNAVKLQFEKNNEYGYQQTGSLSGGMDSRACLLKGINSGYHNNLTYFTYAQSGSLDFQISQKIATDYGLDYLFYPMDSALFVARRYEAMNRNECQQRSIGSTAAATMADLLNTNNVGIIHTGLLGGELMGDLITIVDKSKKTPNNLTKAIHKLFRAKVPSDMLSLDFNLLLDHLRACQNFGHMFSHRCEVYSPFWDEDVFMFVSQIAPVFLYDRNLYIKWMLKHIPNTYVLTHSCCPANASPWKIVAAKAYYTLQKKIIGKSTNQMDPYDFWFHNSPEFRQAFTEELAQLCKSLNKKECTIEAVAASHVYWSEKWMQNTFVLTALHGVENTCQRLNIK